MGVFFKKNQVKITNNALNKKDKKVGFRLQKFHDKEKTNLEYFLKQTQLRYIGFNNLKVKYSLNNYITNQTFNHLSSFFLELSRNYSGISKELKTKFDNINYYFKTKQVFPTYEEIIEIMKYKYCQEYLDRNTKKEIISYCLEVLIKKILVNEENNETKEKDKDKLYTKEDYLMLPGYVKKAVFLSVNDIQVDVEQDINLPIDINSNYVILGTLSLKYFDQKGLTGSQWSIAKYIATEALKKMKERDHRYFIIFTDIQYCQEKISIYEQNKEDMNKYWPEFNLGYDYKNALKKMKQKFIHDLTAKLSQEEIEMIYFHFGDCKTEQSLGPVFRDLEICIKKYRKYLRAKKV